MENLSTKQGLLDSADHWDREAQLSEDMAAWDRSMGVDLSAPGRSAGDHKAAMFRSTARILRMQAETGEIHCHCHEVPASECAFQKMQSKPRISR